MKNEDYSDKSYLRETYAQKLAEAIKFLRERGRYCLEVPLSRRIYSPVHVFPLDFKR